MSRLHRQPRSRSARTEFPGYRAIRAFGRQGGQYRSATEAGLAATNPARSMSGARLTPSVPLQRLVAASLVGREVQSRLLQRDRLDETLVVAPVAPTIAAEVGQELSAAVLDDGHEGEFAASECRLHRQRNTR